VTARAREVLERLERYELDVFAEEIKPEAGLAEQQKEEAYESNGTEPGLKRAARRARSRRIAAQATLFDANNQDLLDELRDVNVDVLSPEDARRLLQSLRARIV
jgi:hypothetical protein